MAETTLRSKLIQQQIENLLQNAPPPVTAAERNQIMKGRDKKGQAEIDKGRAAIKAREEEVRAHNEQIERLSKELGLAQTDEGVAAEKRKREEGSDPWSQIAIPAGIGVLGGAGSSHLINSRIDKYDQNRIRALNEIADEIGPTEKLTNSQMNRSRAVGAAEAAKKYAPATGLGRAAQIGIRGAAYGVPGIAVAVEYKRYNDIANDESKPWEERQAAAKIANGLLGVGTGIAFEGGSRFVLPGGGEGEGRAMMRINTARDYAKRMDDKERIGLGNHEGMRPKGIGTASRPLKTIDAEVIPEAPPPKAIAAPSQVPAAPTAEAKAEVGTKEYYRQLARDLNIKGISRKTKAELIEAITEANQKNTGRKVPKRTPKVPGVLGPVLAGGLAYLATPDDAEASTGEGGDRSSAIGNAAIAGGGAYGTQKLLSSIPRGAGALVGEAMGPVAAMTGPDFTPETERFGRNAVVRDMPFMRHVAGIYGDAYEQAQVPERSPVGAGPRLAEPANPDAAIDEALGIVRRANGGRVSGGFHYDTGGRTDNIPLDVVPGTYIIPADVVSALGQGNTMAGIKVLDNMFPPQMEAPKASAGAKRAEGGRVPIIVAGGEFKVDPYHVAALGEGDVQSGADMLDEWVQSVRQQHIDTLSKLPGPAESVAEEGRQRAPFEQGGHARSVSEDEVQFGYNPIDELRQSINTSVFTPEQAAENRRRTLMEALSVIPGPGNVISAQDAYTGAGDAYDAFQKGDYKGGALSSALAGLSGAGAVLGLPFGKFAKGAADAGKDTLYAIPAWHGSPHDFDEFKLDKIGTGEGAQVYGHGLYFAENPKVAGSYKAALSKNPFPDGDVRHGAWITMNARGEDFTRNFLKSQVPEDQVDDIIKQAKEASSGRLYRTELDVEPEDLLDWDLPLSQQSGKVKGALEGAFGGPLSDNLTGQDLLTRLQLTRRIEPTDMSAKLREAGIPGIRYLDQGSRGAGEGSRNFVIFDDRLVKILGKE